MIRVPRRSLADMEDSFLRLWLTVNNVTAQIEMGKDAQVLVPVLRQELRYAMRSFYHWRKAKWMQGGRSS